MKRPKKYQAGQILISEYDRTVYLASDIDPLLDRLEQLESAKPNKMKHLLINFDDLKVGQTVWTVQDGEVAIIDLDYKSTGDSYPIRTSALQRYTKDGYHTVTDSHPSMFLSNPFEELERLLKKEEFNRLSVQDKNNNVVLRKTDDRDEFPSLEEYRKRFPEHYLYAPDVVYNYFSAFKTRTVYPKVGDEYEFSDDGGKTWHRDFLLMYETELKYYKLIRPISDPTREQVIEKARKLGLTDDEIKLIKDIHDFPD